MLWKPATFKNLAINPPPELADHLLQEGATDSARSDGSARTHRRLARGHPLSILTSFFLQIDSVDAAEEFMLTVAFDSHVFGIMSAGHLEVERFTLKCNHCCGQELADHLPRYKAEIERLRAVVTEITAENLELKKRFEAG